MQAVNVCPFCPCVIRTGTGLRACVQVAELRKEVWDTLGTLRSCCVMTISSLDKVVGYHPVRGCDVTMATKRQALKMLSLPLGALL